MVGFDMALWMQDYLRFTKRWWGIIHGCPSGTEQQFNVA
jgi:hypothetical protein